MRDIPFEAAYLRDAILVGLVHERDVVPWATDLLPSEPTFADAIVGVLSVPVQLSPIRDALRAFGDVDDTSRVTEALFIRAALEPDSPSGGERLLRVLSDVRRLAGCPATHADAIKDFEARAMLATVDGGLAPTAGEITRWLEHVRQPAHFFVPSADRHNAPAFVALDERAWIVARQEGGPLPVGSRIPYPGPPSGMRAD